MKDELGEGDHVVRAVKSSFSSIVGLVLVLAVTVTHPMDNRVTSLEIFIIDKDDVGRGFSNFLSSQTLSHKPFNF